MRYFFLCLWLLVPSMLHAALVVQSISVAGAGVTDVTTGNLTTTSGNLFICDAGYVPDDLVSITDSKSNSYTDSVAVIASSDDAGWKQIQQYKENGTGGASHNWTITMNNPGNYPTIACTEISGVLTSGALDKTASKNDNSGTTGMTSSATATTAQANEILCGAASGIQGGNPLVNFTIQGSFVENENIPLEDGVSVGLLTGCKVVIATGTYEFLFDVDTSSTGVTALISTWKASGTAGIIQRRPIVTQ